MLTVNRRKGWSYKHKKELSGEFRHPFLCSWGLLSFVPHWGQRINSPLTSCCDVISPGLRSIQPIRQRSATSRCHLLIPYSIFSLHVISLSLPVLWCVGTQEISKSVITRALFWVLLKRETMVRFVALRRHPPSPAVQPAAQSEWKASPHAPAPSNARHGSLSRKRASESPVFFLTVRHTDMLSQCFW